LVASRGVPIAGIRRSKGKENCPLCLGEEDVKHIILDCLETRNWRIKSVYGK
jgi:hypothetical protein